MKGIGLGAGDPLKTQNKTLKTPQQKNYENKQNKSK